MRQLQSELTEFALEAWIRPLVAREDGDQLRLLQTLGIDVDLCGHVAECIETELLEFGPCRHVVMPLSASAPVDGAVQGVDCVPARWPAVSIS